MSKGCIEINSLGEKVRKLEPAKVDDHLVKYDKLVEKKGYLATNSIYVCIDHSQNIVKNYFSELEPIFAVINECENGKNINSLLEGPVCHSGFKRLN